jgi:CPSF A subunit region
LSNVHTFNYVIHNIQVDVLTEPPEEKDTTAAADTTDDAATTAAVAEDEDEVDNSHVNYKNFAAPDLAYGGAPPLLVDRFELRVLIVNASISTSSSTSSSSSSSSSGGIEVVQTIALQRDEHALCLEMVTLGPDNDRKPFVICGTGFVGSQGEDSPAKGRLLLYELDYSHVEVAQTEPEAEVAGSLQQRHRHLPKLRLAQEKIMSGE